MDQPPHRSHQALSIIIVWEVEKRIDEQFVLVDDCERRAPRGKFFIVLMYS